MAVVYPTISQTTNTTSPAMVINGAGYPGNGILLSPEIAAYQGPRSLGVNVNSTGTVTVSVQVSCDPPSALSNWTAIATTGGLVFQQAPVSAIRLVTSAGTGTFSAAVGVVQWP